jgi:Flp pilus assembly pilin Flp
MFSQIKRFIKDERGASGQEYAALFIIVAAVVAGAKMIAPKITALFNNAGF